MFKSQLGKILQNKELPTRVHPESALRNFKGERESLSVRRTGVHRWHSVERT